MTEKTAAEVVTVRVEDVTPDAHEADAQRSIMELLSAWGKRTTYRYLRDHGLLEAFTENLPMGSYEESDEVTITAILQDSWDDFSADKLKAMRDWQMRSAEGALGIRIAAYAAHLGSLGFQDEANEVLRISETVDSAQRVDTRVIEAAQLEVGDVVQKIGSVAGFGPKQMPGRVTEVSMTNNVVTARVTIPQLEGGEGFSVHASSPVTVMHVVRPHYARSLRTSALAKLQATEAALEANPELQSRVARLRHMLATRIQSDE